jgi:short-subunit dehydrogenase
VNPTPSKVIFITGASSGIGYALALAYARRGDRVAAFARRSDRLDSLIAAAGSAGSSILPLVGDVTQAQDVTQAIQTIDQRWGRLDICIANAGIGHRGAITTAAWSDLDAVLRTNIDGVLHTIRAADSLLARSGGGQIVTISSVLSIAIGPYSTIYSASKATVNALVRGLRQEMAAQGTRFTNVMLGQTHTEFSQARRGVPGKVAGGLPTMTAEFVADRIIAAVDRRQARLTLRPVDHLIMLGGALFPAIMGRILVRVYRAR